MCSGSNELPGFSRVLLGNFKLLGCPFGDPDYCALHTRSRAAKATGLLSQVTSLSEPQAAIQLIRQCAGFSKLTYSARTVPPQLHAEALLDFESEMRSALSAVVGTQVEGRSWTQAQLSLRQGGLGLRCVAMHAPAAFVASVLSARDLCARIDPSFSLEDVGGHLGLQGAWSLLRNRVSPEANVDIHEQSPTQKYLSGLVDAQHLTTLKAATATDLSFQAHLSLVGQATAGAWLTALPVDDGRAIEGDLFRVAIKRRLRVPMQEEDGFCPLCGQGMDRFGDHALTCQCRGDRTGRHNCIRNVGCEEAILAGAQPEREKAGLLPARPQEDGILGPPSSRRPADIFLPRGETGAPVALDFAVTSGLRQDWLRAVVAHPNHVFEEYEAFKRSYQDTEGICQSAGFRFLPMVMKAHGGSWSPAAQKAWDWLAKNQRASWSDGYEPTSLRIAQRLSCSLHRENARAILRRQVIPSTDLCADAWAFDGCWQ